MSKIFPHNSSLKTARHVTSTFLWPPAFERTASVHLRVCTSSSLPRAAACGPAPQPRQRALRTGPQLQPPWVPLLSLAFPRLPLWLLVPWRLPLPQWGAPRPSPRLRPPSLAALCLLPLSCSLAKPEAFPDFHDGTVSSAGAQNRNPSYGSPAARPCRPGFLWSVTTVQTFAAVPTATWSRPADPASRLQPSVWLSLLRNVQALHVLARAPLPIPALVQLPAP